MDRLIFAKSVMRTMVTVLPKITFTAKQFRTESRKNLWDDLFLWQLLQHPPGTHEESSDLEIMPKRVGTTLARGESAKALKLATSATLMVTSADRFPDLMSKFPHFVTPRATRNLQGSGEQNVFGNQAKAVKVKSRHTLPKKAGPETRWQPLRALAQQRTEPPVRPGCPGGTTCSTKPGVLVANLPSPKLTAPLQHRFPSPSYLQTYASRDFTAKPQQAWAKTSVVLSASRVL